MIVSMRRLGCQALSGYDWRWFLGAAIHTSTNPWGMNLKHLPNTIINLKHGLKEMSELGPDFGTHQHIWKVFEHLPYVVRHPVPVSGSTWPCKPLKLHWRAVTASYHFANNIKLSRQSTCWPQFWHSACALFAQQSWLISQKNISNKHRRSTPGTRD